MSIHKANMTEVFVVTVAIGAWNVVVWVVVEIKVYTAQGHREGPEPHHRGHAPKRQPHKW